MDIIPHSKLCKTEVSDYAGLNNIPSLQSIESTSDHSENSLYIDAVCIQGQRIQTRNLQVVVLLQHLKKGGIEMCIFITGMKSVALIGGFPNNLNREKN